MDILCIQSCVLKSLSVISRSAVRLTLTARGRIATVKDTELCFKKFIRGKILKNLFALKSYKDKKINYNKYNVKLKIVSSLSRVIFLENNLLFCVGKTAASSSN